MAYHPNKNLEALFKEIRDTGASKTMSIRDFLAGFGHERRNVNVNWVIREHLKENEIEVEPNFETNWIDSQITLIKKPTIRTKNKVDETVEYFDPIPRIKMLKASNRQLLEEGEGRLISVNRDTDLSAATTLMLLHDFSQLPVMNGSTAVGIVSWKSIGEAGALKKECAKVGDCMHPVEVLSDETPLFEAVKIISNKEVVLVMGQGKSITGLITTADIAEQFISLAEPFLILEQIENHIRGILDGKFTQDEITSSLQSSIESSRKINTISDLTFGQYIRILENPDKWNKIDINIDRSIFVKRLHEVREIRNDIMHFDPEGTSEKKIALLRETSSFFATLNRVKKIKKGKNE